MSRFIRRFRHFMRRIFSRNRPPRRHQDLIESGPEQIQYQEGSRSEPIDQPSSFPDTIRIFGSLVVSLYEDPGRLDAVRESRTFRLCLHCIAYRISVCGYLIYRNTSVLKHYAELARLGFMPPDDEDFITLGEKEISDRQEEKAALTGLLDQARHLGLRQDVDNVTRACQLDLEVRRLMSLANYEEDSGRWDQVLRYIAEAVNLLSERNESWPSWPDLDLTRQQIMDTVRVYGLEDRDRETECWVLLHLLHASNSFLPPHAADARKHVNFHSQYLDQEVGLMSRFLAERSRKRIIQAVGKLMTSDDKNFCELGIESVDDFSPHLPTHRFGLRLYRLCWRLGDGDLADSAMSIRFVENLDKQRVTELLNRILTRLRYNPRQASDRIQLNGELDDVTSDYKLPQLLPDVEEPLHDEPWWVAVFRQRNETTQPESVAINPPTGASASSAADTLLPSSSFVRECNQAAIVMIQEREETAADPRSVNREVARLFITTDSIHDRDTYTIPFSYISTNIDNPITLKLEDQDRKTNIAAGVPYHCSVLTYHPAQDEWSVRPDMCRISGPLAVEQEGATCVPFVGDCGIDYIPDSFVFKIHKSRSEHALREYTADVRAQSTAAWYVNRFRELTQDKFGVLAMIHSDLVIVYQDSNRDIILELMTREAHNRVGSAVKFDKYTNNTSYINRKVNTEFLEAFSHFTHHASEGTLMVTDIQGWVGWYEALDNIGYTLTDPVIHCPGLYYRFGGTNRELQGIRDFFQHVHPTCNHICEFLKLTRPEEYRV